MTVGLATPLAITTPQWAAAAKALATAAAIPRATPMAPSIAPLTATSTTRMQWQGPASASPSQLLDGR